MGMNLNENENLNVNSLNDQEREKTITSADLSRADTRSLVFHLLYAVESFEYENSLDAIVDSYNRGFNLDIKVTDEVFTIAQQVVDNRDSLDELIKPLLINWRFDRIGVATKLILRFALWEMREQDTPTIVVMNEFVELAKCFAEKDAHKFVNGILDKAVEQMPELKKN